MMHTVLDKGIFKKVDKLDDDHLEFPSASDLFALPSNLIPGLNGVSGGRVLLGSKAALQAVSLTDRQVPLVQSYSGKKGDKSFVKIYGKHLLSIVAEKPGKISKITDDQIIVDNDDGSTTDYQLYHNFNLGRKSYIEHTPIVKVGDTIKADEVLAKSNYTDNSGQLAMGTNLTTAVMPFRSGNFEDAWVLSEAGAAKLNADQMLKFHIEKKFGLETDKNKYISLFPNKFLNEQLLRIDADGIIKVGQVVSHGDPVILAYSPKTLKSTDVHLGKLSKVLRNAFRDDAQTWEYDHPGTVVDVSKTDTLITVHIRTVRSMGVGDKLSCAWGAKGVCGSVVPNSQVPLDKDGKPVDIMLNSMSVTSRVAPAMIVALGLGKLAQKLGHPVNMTQFTGKSSVQSAIDVLKKNKIDDLEEVYDPVTNKSMKVMLGPLYFTRLVHVAEDKLSSRAQGISYTIDMQPAKTEQESAKRSGNLSTTALLSHGATSVLRDIATIRGTKNDDFWRALKLGQQPPPAKVPFIFNKFLATLQGAGINVTRKGNVYNILPMTDKDITSMSNGPINSPATFKVKKDSIIPEDGGLFDPTKVGIYGDRFNHIDLNVPVPNPISEEYLRKLLGVTQKEYEKMITDGTLGDKLKDIDLNDKIAESKKYLVSGKRTKRDDAVKTLSFLNTLKQNGLHPKDLMLSKVPIIPAQYRPTMSSGGTTMTADVNNLYRELIMNNNSLKDTKNLPDDIQDKLKKDQYAGVKAIYGLGDPINKKSKDKHIRGLLSTALGLKGGSAKSTMFQSKVVNKPLDLVGRAVLTPDAKLDLDQASVPQELLWHVYKPFLTRRLVMNGVPATKAAEYIESKNPVAIRAMNDELATRPGIVSRDPSLHKYNLTGFYLVPNPNPKDKTVKLNPLVFKSLNADNDGDQLNISIPASEDARQEVLDKMLPSKNLLSPKNIAPMYLPSNEAALGLYQMTTEKKDGTPKKFKNSKEVADAYHKGTLDAGDLVDVG